MEIEKYGIFICCYFVMDVCRLHQPLLQCTTIMQIYKKMHYYRKCNELKKVWRISDRYHSVLQRRITAQ